MSAANVPSRGTGLTPSGPRKVRSGPAAAIVSSQGHERPKRSSSVRRHPGLRWRTAELSEGASPGSLRAAPPSRPPRKRPENALPRFLARDVHCFLRSRFFIPDSRSW